MEQLRQVIGLRQYGQKDPLSEFKKEAFVLFENLLQKIRNDLIKFLLNLNIVVSNEKVRSESLDKNHDFKSEKKEDFKPDSLKILKKRRFVNSLVLLLYIDILLIFLFLNSWISQLLILLTGNQIDNNF